MIAAIARPAGHGRTVSSAVVQGVVSQLVRGTGAWGQSESWRGVQGFDALAVVVEFDLAAGAALRAPFDKSSRRAGSVSTRATGCLRSAVVGAVQDAIGDGLQLIEAAVGAERGHIRHREPRGGLVAGFSGDVGAANRDQDIVYRGVSLREDDVDLAEVRVDQGGETMHVLGLARLMVPLRARVWTVFGREKEDRTVGTREQHSLRPGSAVAPRVGAVLVDIVSVRSVFDGSDALPSGDEYRDESLDQRRLSHTRGADERNH